MIEIRMEMKNLLLRLSVIIDFDETSLQAFRESRSDRPKYSRMLWDVDVNRTNKHIRPFGNFQTGQWLWREQSMWFADSTRHDGPEIYTFVILFWRGDIVRIFFMIYKF